MATYSPNLIIPSKVPGPLLPVREDAVRLADLLELLLVLLLLVLRRVRVTVCKKHARSVMKL